MTKIQGDVICILRPWFMMYVIPSYVAEHKDELYTFDTTMLL